MARLLGPGFFSSRTHLFLFSFLAFPLCWYCAILPVHDQKTSSHISWLCCPPTPNLTILLLLVTVCCWCLPVSNICHYLPNPSLAASFSLPKNMNCPCKDHPCFSFCRWKTSNVFQAQGKVSKIEKYVEAAKKKITGWVILQGKWQSKKSGMEVDR